MIESDQWLSLLGERTKISYESLNLLQKDFVTLVANRLAKDEDAIIPFVGKLVRSFRKSFIAVIDEDTSFIVPPRVELSLYRIERGGWRSFCDLLRELSPLTKDIVESYFSTFEDLVVESLEKKEIIEWKDLGTLYPYETEANVCFSFSPAESLCKRLNGAFSFYEPIPLADKALFPQLDRISYPSIEEATASLSLFPRSDNSFSLSQKKEDKVEIIIPPIRDVKENPIETTEGDKNELDSPNKESKNRIEVSPPPISTTISPITEGSLIPPPISLNKEHLISPPPIPIRRTSLMTKNDGDEEEEGEKRKKKKHLFLWIFVSFFLVLFILGVIFFFYTESISIDTGKTQRNLPIEKEKTVSSPEKEDSILLSQKVESSQTSSNEMTTSTAPPLGSVTIEEGNTLSAIARKYYGNRLFWVYIYEENREKIPNPNSIPLGTILTLPAPEKYAIDAKSENSLAMAKEKEREINNQPLKKNTFSRQKSPKRFPSKDEIY